MPRSVQDLFERLEQRTSAGEERSVKLSYLEVYNETVKDLLAPGRPLVLRDGEQVGVTLWVQYNFVGFSIEAAILNQSPEGFGFIQDSRTQILNELNPKQIQNLGSV